MPGENANHLPTGGEGRWGTRCVPKVRTRSSTMAAAASAPPPSHSSPSTSATDRYAGVSWRGRGEISHPQEGAASDVDGLCQAETPISTGSAQQGGRRILCRAPAYRGGLNTRRSSQPNPGLGMGRGDGGPAVPGLTRSSRMAAALWLAAAVPIELLLRGGLRELGSCGYHELITTLWRRYPAGD